MEASPVFHDMMSMPSPPPAESPDGLPVVEFNEEGPMLEILLRFIYPMPNPNVDSLDQLYAIINVVRNFLNSTLQLVQAKATRISRLKNTSAKVYSTLSANFSSHPPSSKRPQFASTQ
jgi:hypothetical protein